MCSGGKLRGWIAQKVIFIISLPFICHSQTALQISNSPSPVEALLGQNVTIPCILTDKDQPQRDLNLDFSTDSVRWDMRSLDGSERTVYLFTQGQHTSYRQTSNVDGIEFKRGNASLTLYKVQKSDEGDYVCNIFVAGNKYFALRAVEVSARPVVILSSHKVTIALGNEQSVACEVCKFYPESVKIRWEKRSSSSEMSALDKETCTSVPTQADDGTFNVTSLMSVKPSSLHEDGDEYFCIVSHRSLKSEHAENFTVIVQELPASNFVPLIIAISLFLVVIAAAALAFYFKKFPPKISDIAGIDNLVHDKSANLSWMVSGFKPRKIEIRVYLKRGDKQQDIMSWKYPSPQVLNYDAVDHAETGEDYRLVDQHNTIQPLTPKSSFFSYSCLCSINITPEKKKDKEAKLVIEVKHAALKRTLTKHKKLNITGDLFTCHIPAPQCLKHGEEVTLTCDVTKCDPEPLSITWMKGKEVIYKDGVEQNSRYSYTETPNVPQEGNVLKSSSSLTFKATVKEDHQVKYSCRVYYSAIEKMLTSHLEALVTAQPVVEEITSKRVREKMELSCRIRSFYPQTIAVKWYKEDEELPTTDGELHTGEDGLFSTTSVLIYVPEMGDIGKTFRCEVDHQTLSSPETRKWRLEEQTVHGIPS